MFYRRKIILALLELFDGQLEKIRLQKLLFLFTRQQAKADYDFVPYRFGCYSHSANADMTAMVRRGFLEEGDKYFIKKDSTRFLNQLKPDDKKLMLEIENSYGKMSADALIKHTYTNFPFYATRSEVAERILSASELKIVSDSQMRGTKTILFTIGYEGISLEEYLVRLLKHDVKVLVDVRNNPLSMKYGFSKSLLRNFCENLGIQYVHIPEVGIKGEQRRELNSQADYDLLFYAYREENLPKTKASQQQISELLQAHKRIALTCFEAQICQCHRRSLAEAITTLPGWNYELSHI